MGRYIRTHRYNSDLKFSISLLILGFITLGALLIFYGYTVAR